MSFTICYLYCQLNVSIIMIIIYKMISLFNYQCSNYDFKLLD